jgi:hypothetical protein
MKFLSRMIGAFEGAMLVVTTLVMVAPFFLALMHPGASIGHAG